MKAPSRGRISKLFTEGIIKCQTNVEEGRDMKYIIAIIQPGKLTAVHDALLEIGITGMTVTEVQGYGRQKGKSEIYRGAEYTVHFLPKVKIELAVPEKMAAKTVEAIKAASNSGKIGDGKIFTFDLQDAVRIRTSETGQSAL
jgi:nitrogen regulatory protein P-II 2